MIIYQFFLFPKFLHFQFLEGGIKKNNFTLFLSKHACFLSFFCGQEAIFSFQTSYFLATRKDWTTICFTLNIERFLPIVHQVKKMLKILEKVTDWKFWIIIVTLFYFFETIRLICPFNGKKRNFDERNSAKKTAKKAQKMAQKKHIIFNGRSISIKTLHKGGFEKASWCGCFRKLL